ncbi:MAG TPA: carboxypeptidase-like regulatory domain-containing protein [Thermoanaerobaculia bacterium]|nr:carboxypeptidase-like regulatory domain-containing protein [Thermoanaerobaculia bacterium]
MKLKKGGTVEVRFEAPRTSLLRLPDAFIAGVLMNGDGSPELDRILCWRVVEESQAGEEIAGLFACPTPAGTLSLRIELPAFATAYVWELEVTEAGTARTRVRLASPVSLFGEAAETDVTATLVPRGLKDNDDRVAFAGQTRELPRGGTLRFEGVAPGAYAYRLKAGDGRSAKAMIVVPDGAPELELPALSLPVRVALTVQVSPPRDGAGEPWILHLVPRATNPHTTTPVKVAADLSGWQALPEVEAGDYLLLVEDSLGSLWLTEQVALEADDVLWLDLSRVAVEGRAMRGEEPFVGDLIFGGTHGSRRFTFATDDGGRFTGLLPEEGPWEVEISSEKLGCAPCDGSPGTLRIPPVEVKGGPSGKAWLEIEIPNTRLAGRVVVVETAESGETVRRPQPGATVLVMRVSGAQDSGGLEAQIWSDDGDFELVGLVPGEVRLVAMHPELPYESEWKAVRIAEGDDEPSVELVLRPKAALKVRVVSPSGPVGGATVTASVPDGKSARGISGADGAAVLELASETRGTLVVEAAGYGIALEPFQTAGGGLAPPEVQVPLAPAAGSLVLSRLPYNVVDEGWLISERGGQLSLRAFWMLLADSISFGEAITLANLAPGTYTLCTERGDCRQDVVYPGAFTELDLSETR